MGLDIYGFIVDSKLSLSEKEPYSKPLDIAENNLLLRKFIRVLSALDDTDISEVLEIERDYEKEDYYIDFLKSFLNNRLDNSEYQFNHDEIENFIKMFKIYSCLDSDDKENIFFNENNEIYIARKDYELKDSLVELARYYLGDDLNASSINGLPILYKLDEEKIKNMIGKFRPASLDTITEEQTFAIEINF